MAAFEFKPGQGGLYPNQRKLTDNHPDFTGTFIAPDGKPYWLSAWKKRSNNGNEWWSLDSRPKDSDTKTAEPISERAKARDPEWARGKKEEIEDDIPW